MVELIHPRRGEIYWVEWTPHRGSEQTGTRPSLVVSIDALNRNLTVCTVLAITTKIRPSQFAVTLPATVTGTPSQIHPWQIMTISNTRLDGHVATLPADLLLQVETSMRRVWGL